MCGPKGTLKCLPLVQPSPQSLRDENSIGIELVSVVISLPLAHLTDLHPELVEQPPIHPGARVLSLQQVKLAEFIAAVVRARREHCVAFLQIVREHFHCCHADDLQVAEETILDNRAILVVEAVWRTSWLGAQPSPHALMG